jgi:hypothetical protein
MAAPSVTNTFTNGTTADATEVNQNFDDVINALTDGTSDLTFNQLTANGAAVFNGTVTLGNATGDTITFTGYAGSSLIPDTNASYDFGTSALGWQALYLDNDTTDGGSIFFNAGGSSIVSTADGLTLDFNTFTTLDLNATAAIAGATAVGNGSNAIITFVDSTQDEVVVNQAGGDCDFRVEGDSDTHLMFCDAANDRVAIGHSSPSFLFHVSKSINDTVARIVNSNTGSSAIPLQVFGSSGTGTTSVFECQDNGTLGVVFKVGHNGIMYCDTTNWNASSTQDVGVSNGAGAGQIQKFSSSRRYKNDIRDLPYGTDWIFDLRPVAFTFKNDNPEALASKSVGYIAEEVSEIAPKEFVFFGEDDQGKPREESLHYKLFVVPLIAELKKLRERVARLEGDA